MSSPLLARARLVGAAALALLQLPGCTSQAASMTPHATAADWGTVDGKTVQLCTLVNQSGGVCKIASYGATVVELHVPDRDGELGDVALGFDQVQEYVDGSPYFGCTVGRVANRIKGGVFTLDGANYTLATNNGPNHLHGGNKGFDKAVWTIKELSSADYGARVVMTHASPDGDEGYPGNVDVTVTYTWGPDNQLEIDMKATTDAPTIVNLAHHTYWNLAGHGSGSILDHELELRCNAYTPADGTLIPTGELAAVEGTPFDFRNRKRIAADIAVLKAQKNAGHGGGYDVNLVVDGEPTELRSVALLCDPTSGRTMEIVANQPGLQFYTGNFLDGSLTGKDGAVYAQHSGLCLETQRFPDAINHPDFFPVVLRPGEVYHHVMVHKFTAE